MQWFQDFTLDNQEDQLSWDHQSTMHKVKFCRALINTQVYQHSEKPTDFTEDTKLNLLEQFKCTTAINYSVMIIKWPDSIE